MRASFWVIAPLLARMGEARVSLPGGCAIGTRPVDLLLMALERLGAKIEIDAGYVVAKAPQRAHRRRNRISQGDGRRHPYRADGRRDRAWLDARSATPPASRRSRTSPIASTRWARASTAPARSTIEVTGVARLNGAHHCVLPDRIEAGTYATAVAMTGGDVLLEGVSPDLLQEALDALAAGRRDGVERQSRRAGAAQRRGNRRGRHFDRALPRIPDRSAGAVHGADDARAAASRASPRRSSRTASCTCRSSRGSARTSSSRATPRSSKASSGCAARP